LNISINTLDDGFDSKILKLVDNFTRMGKQKEAGGFRSFVGGGFGGICCVISGQPFDTIKVGSSLILINNLKS
jgi:hypothetical protein